MVATLAPRLIVAGLLRTSRRGVGDLAMIVEKDSNQKTKTQPRNMSTSSIYNVSSVVLWALSEISRWAEKLIVLEFVLLRLHGFVILII